MKGILIDPEAKTITEIDYNGDYHQIYDLTGCETFTVVRLDDENTLFVDDEGLLKDPEFFFSYEGYHQPLAGKGLILGVDEEGESVATTLDIEYVTSKIKYLRLKVAGFDTSEGQTTLHGKPAFFIRNTPIFEERE